MFLVQQSTGNWTGRFMLFCHSFASYSFFLSHSLCSLFLWSISLFLPFTCSLSLFLSQSLPLWSFTQTCTYLTHALCLSLSLSLSLYIYLIYLCPWLFRSWFSNPWLPFSSLSLKSLYFIFFWFTPDIYCHWGGYFILFSFSASFVGYFFLLLLLLFFCSQCL